MVSYFDEVIDGVIYINLIDRVDRNEHMIQELSRMGFSKTKIHRLDAVYNQICGHLGCTDSHIKALDFARNQQWKRFMILEDDFHFKLSIPETDNILKTFFDKYQDNWDVFMLATVWTQKKDTDIDCIKKIISGTTTSGYLVNMNYLEIIYDNFVESRNNLFKEVEEKKLLEPENRVLYVSNPIDQHWFSLQSKDRFFISEPYIGGQGGFWSSIMSK
jgi:GR25 family glycosyltransferase involved in LPS biosynthesis